MRGRCGAELSGVLGRDSQTCAHDLCRPRQSRVPSVGDTLKRVTGWLCSDDRSTSSCSSHVTDTWYRGGDWHRNTGLSKISRTADGRFVLASDDSVTTASSSDDGGFLPRRGRRRASWRRPLVACPSQLSLRSDGSGESGLAAILGRFSNLPRMYSVRPASPAVPAPPRLRASSPATPGPLLATAWSPSYNFSDLSSVRQISSSVGERSFPTASSFTMTPPGYLQLRSVHQRYSQELPSLRAIHEETTRWRPQPVSPLFVPVHPLATSSPPRVRIPPPRVEQPAPITRPKARLPPRHARHARSAPELAESSDPLLMETSPSSSSGFGSKNTSQQNQSSHSGGSASVEWRLPPYRPPPPPPSSLTQLLERPHWLQFTPPSPSHSEPSKPLDASVDGHYEFDPVFAATPTPSTPTGVRTVETRGISDSELCPQQRAKRQTRYDNIEARVQAMKEEFNEFRKRQAKRRRSDELESAC